MQATQGERVKSPSAAPAFRPAEVRAAAAAATPRPEPAAAPAGPLVRPRAAGKFLSVGGEKFVIRGVTYGPFAPESDGGGEYKTSPVVAADFAAMRRNGINAVRVYTVPPPWLLDEAAAHGLRVMVGLPWEQHVAFLDLGRRRARDLRRRVAEGVRRCAAHPAVLAYAIGNEIPAPVVRWYGHRRVERYLEQLYRVAKDQDPEGLVTYVNYPSTEYLDLPFLDVVGFNVYLEARRDLQAYLSRLQNIAGDRPLLMAEVGLDVRRHGEDAQAAVLGWQTRTVMRAGCCGLFVFAWTDEWHRGGADITDWSFGLTDRHRRPRPALDAVRGAFEAESVPAPDRPGVSVVVCTYNGGRTLADCLDGLAKLNYPNYETIVVDDGSTDDSAQIARRYDVRLIRTENRGLSSARNTGWEAARNEIVAYIDDDARPDPDWLTHLADTFAADANHAGVGGPNIPPDGCGLVADAVAAAPGGPVHVLLTDRIAEHIPGCNMAFLRSCLQAIGGFDPQFRIAGDDVDVCWRMQDRGWTLGFNPAAMVWHRRRGSVKAYWRQQLNYGRAEADLERKWPQKYNAAGHLTWSGRLYSHGLPSLFGWWARRRIYHGVWGSALFQSVYHLPPSWLWSVPAMPEWYVLVVLLAVACAASLAGAAWVPLAWSLPLLLLLTAGATVLQAWNGASRSLASRAALRGPRRWRLFALTAGLHLIQPAARLMGRLGRGLTPWRRRGVRGFTLPRVRTHTAWSETWQAPEQRLAALRSGLTDAGAIVSTGGEFDRWDFEVRGGVLGAVRASLLAEEHGQGRQFVRLRTWPRMARWARATAGVLAALAVAATVAGKPVAAAVVGLPVVLMLLRAVYECGAASAAVARAAESAGAVDGARPVASGGDAPAGSGDRAVVVGDDDDEVEDLGLGGIR